MTFALGWMLPAFIVVVQSAGTVGPPQNVVEEIACAPATLPAPPHAMMRVSGGYQHGRIMFGPGESLIVNAGTRQGVQKGQRYYVRRHVHDLFTEGSTDSAPVNIHTAGWVTVVDAGENVAVAEVTHACDGILDGDYLEPYSDPTIPPAALGGAPDYGSPARIVMADDKMQTGSAGTLMLINRGSDQGVVAGQTLTIFREPRKGTDPMFDVGRGTVLSVRAQTALIRVDASRDAVYVGDLAALHRKH